MKHIYIWILLLWSIPTYCFSQSLTVRDRDATKVGPPRPANIPSSELSL